MGECLLSLNAWETKQRWDTIAFFDTTGVEKSKYISSNAKEFKLQDTSSLKSLRGGDMTNKSLTVQIVLGKNLRDLLSIPAHHAIPSEETRK